MKFLGRDKFGFLYAKMDFGTNCILSLVKRKGVAEVYSEGDLSGRGIFIGFIYTERTAKGTLHKLNDLYKGQKYYSLPRTL